jgi:HTH-type transcriptional regulator/antitoxin HigA
MDSLSKIRTEADYHTALERAKVILQAQPSEPEFEELAILATILEEYEAAHYPMLP